MRRRWRARGAHGMNGYLVLVDDARYAVQAETAHQAANRARDVLGGTAQRVDAGRQLTDDELAVLQLTLGEVRVSGRASHYLAGRQAYASASAWMRIAVARRSSSARCARAYFVNTRMMAKRVVSAGTHDPRIDGPPSCSAVAVKSWTAAMYAQHSAGSRPAGIVTTCPFTTAPFASASYWRSNSLAVTA